MKFIEEIYEEIKTKPLFLKEHALEKRRKLLRFTLKVRESLKALVKTRKQNFNVPSKIRQNKDKDIGSS